LKSSRDDKLTFGNVQPQGFLWDCTKIVFYRLGWGVVGFAAGGQACHRGKQDGCGEKVCGFQVSKKFLFHGMHKYLKAKIYLYDFILLL
jgi:hypothetical protein